MLALLGSTSCAASSGEEVDDTFFSTWLWDTTRIEQNPAQLVKDIQKKKVKRVYLQINHEVPILAYQRFIKSANSIGITVYALDGSRTWATSGQSDYAAFWDWIGYYQEEVAVDERFKGVHLDVEPYLLPNWEKNQLQIVSAYEEMIRDAANRAKALQVPVGADIPFWFDEIDSKTESDSLAYSVIKMVDEVTIMAYRNKAKGENGFIELTKNERRWGSVFSTPIEIGLETVPSTEGKFISFASKGEAAMMQEIQEMILIVDDKSTRFSIHHFDSWVNMKK